ncbi:MAG: hypothetical protein H0T59_10560 [Chloroflexi bacterium]|nr:hypothetical protein [Chloroflexota bacterium]
MDKPADPATPFREVYQPFLDDLAMHGRKPATINRYRYNIVRFAAWLDATERPTVLASLEQTILFGYRQYLETLPQQPRGSTRRRRGGLMSSHTVHSYLRSIKCLASWLLGSGHILTNPFLATNPYYKDRGVMPVLRADDRIPFGWVLAWPGVTGAIVGARSPEQVDGWIGGGSIRLTEDDLAEIADVIERTDAGAGPVRPDVEVVRL